MSVQSVHEKVARRVINPYRDCCRSIAIEMNYRSGSLPDNIHDNYYYKIGILGRVALSRSERLHKAYFDSVLRHMGKLASDDAQYIYVKTERGFVRETDELFDNGWMVTFEIATQDAQFHTLGLTRDSEGRFRTRALWKPRWAKGVVEPQQIMDHIYLEDVPFYRDYPITGSNIMAIPKVA